MNYLYQEQPLFVITAANASGSVCSRNRHYNNYVTSTTTISMLVYFFETRSGSGQDCHRGTAGAGVLRITTPLNQLVVLARLNEGYRKRSFPAALKLQQGFSPILNRGVLWEL